MGFDAPLLPDGRFEGGGGGWLKNDEIVTSWNTYIYK